MLPHAELALESMTCVNPNLFFRPVNFVFMNGKSMEKSVPVRFRSKNSPVSKLRLHSYGQVNR